MGINDILITPIFLMLIYAAAFVMRNLSSDAQTKKYFIPALTVKLIGGVSVGLIYYFYYGNGDTVAYFERGAFHLYEAMWDSPGKAIDLLFRPDDPTYYPNEYAWRILWFHTTAEYFVIKVTALCSFITFHTYAANACIFGFISFTGIWAMYTRLYKMYPHLSKYLAYGVLFLPSVFFWGSGILKDTISLGALGWMFYGVINIVKLKRRYIFSSIMVAISVYSLSLVKIYILLCFVPAAVLWASLEYLGQVKNLLIRVLITPLLLGLGVGGAVLLFQKIGESNARYNTETLAKTAQETAWWIQHSSEEQGGSTYSLGDLDFSPVGILKKTPAAIWVTLFRPHPWEVRNPVMLLTSLECTFFLGYTFYIIFLWLKSPKRIWSSDVAFYLLFSLIFALAVGISTYNFGALARYKIPMMPFYMVALLLMHAKLKPELFINQDSK